MPLVFEPPPARTLGQESMRVFRFGVYFGQHVVGTAGKGTAVSLFPRLRIFSSFCFLFFGKLVKAEDRHEGK
jgi:hypothetical protein